MPVSPVQFRFYENKSCTNLAVSHACSMFRQSRLPQSYHAKSVGWRVQSITSLNIFFFDVFPTVHHSIGYFYRTNFNAHFNMKMYVTLSWTCFGPWHAHLQEEQLHKHSIWYPRSTRRLHTTPVESGHQIIIMGITSPNIQNLICLLVS